MSTPALPAIMQVPATEPEGDEMSSRRVRTGRPRCVVAGVIGAVLALSLSGCGGASGPAEFSEATTVLTQKQANAALLTADALGRGFVRYRDDDGDDSPKETGCAAKLNEEEGPPAAITSEASFKRAGKMPFPFVQATVESYSTADQLADAMQEFRDDLASCPKVVLKGDGMTMTIKLQTDNVPSTSEVEEQINIRGLGTMASKKLPREIPFGLWMSVAKVGNQAVSVELMDINPDSGQLLNKFTAKAVDRVVAVAQGKPLDEKKKPAKPKSTDDAKAKSNA